MQADGSLNTTLGSLIALFTIAEQVERFSGYLRDNDMRGMMSNLEDVARRSPGSCDFS